MSSHACLKCRRGFGRRHSHGDYRGEAPHCPECGGELTYMGWAFKAPKRHDVKQWRKVELLRRAGVLFDGDRDYPPLDTLREAEEFLAERENKTGK